MMHVTDVDLDSSSRPAEFGWIEPNGRRIAYTDGVWKHAGTKYWWTGIHACIA